MLDPQLQQRFARSCAEAAFGYSAASAAAYAAFADQVLGFWSSVLRVSPANAEPRSELWRWPMPLGPADFLPSPAPPPAPASPFAGLPFNPFAWALPAAPQPAPPPPQNPFANPLMANSMMAAPMAAMAMFAEAVTGAMSAMSGAPVKSIVDTANPMTAWMSMLPFAKQSAAWPMAVVMMSSGVPHAVAWPTAEANVAALDAAEAARQSFKQALAGYQSDDGRAAGGNAWPPQANFLTLMAMVPLNIGTMFTALKLS